MITAAEIQRTTSIVKVTVAIPTCGRDAVLVRTIQGVREQEDPPDEVMVVDQCPGHTAEVTAALGGLRDSGQIRYITLPEANLPAARNVALRQSMCEVVIFIDDDVKLPRGFVSAHRKNYVDTEVAAVGGRVTSPDADMGPVSSVAGVVRKLDRRILFPATPSGYSSPGELDYRYLRVGSPCSVSSVANFPGGNHSVRRDCALAVGGYDERYIGRAYREDSDMALRMWKAGYRIKFCADAWLEHLCAPTGGTRNRHGKGAFAWFYERCYSDLLFQFTHFYPRRAFWDEVFRVHLRAYLVTGETVRRPWLFPVACSAYLAAWGKASAERKHAWTGDER